MAKVGLEVERWRMAKAGLEVERDSISRWSPKVRWREIVAAGARGQVSGLHTCETAEQPGQGWRGAKDRCNGWVRSQDMGAGAARWVLGEGWRGTWNRCMG